MHSILHKSLLGLALVVVAATTTSVSAQEAVGLGTWKLNIEKSKFSPGPAPRGITTRFEAAGKGMKWTGQRIGDDGKTTTSEFTANYDRKDYPLKGSPTADAVSLRRINALTTERVNKKEGKLVSTEIREVAKNGKSYVTTVKGTTATGAPINNTMVFDKQ